MGCVIWGVYTLFPCTVERDRFADDPGVPLKFQLNINGNQ